MNKGMVSVVVPTYNYARYVTQAVDSALAQTYRNLEVIVIDDGSTDDTRDRLAPYGDRIKVIHQQNRGLSAARNTGIREARGEWIALLDADDLWHPEKTEIQLKALALHGQSGLIGTLETSEITDLLEPPAPDPNVRILELRDFLLHIPFGPSSALIRRSCFDEVGLFDESLTSLEDRDMWLRIATRIPAIRVESVCWFYRHHPTQMIRNIKRMYTNYAIVLNRFFEQNPELVSYRPIAKSYLDYDIAWCYMSQGETQRAIQRLVASLISCPWNLDRNDPQYRWCRARLLFRSIFGAQLTRVAARLRSFPQKIWASD